MADESHALRDALLRKVLADAGKVQRDNVDTLRFPERAAARLLSSQGMKERLVRALGRGRGRNPSERGAALAADRLIAMLDELAEFEATYALLADVPSRRLMVELLAYRILGGQRIKLATNTPAYWRAEAWARRGLVQQPRTIRVPLLDGWLNLYDLRAAGFPLRLHAHPLNVLDTFLLEQYSYRDGQGGVEVEDGDTVLDAGACWGDTALYFAKRAGPTGRVDSFEFAPGNLAIFRRNLELNQALAGRITVVPRPLWSASGVTLEYAEAGPGTTLAAATPPTAPLKAETVAIDDWVRETGLAQVDFIKMDIEGAELDALRGAAQTLQAFRPKLAISVYHKPDDLATIPRYLASLGLGYRFFLKHVTIHLEETVLFASPAD